MRGSRTRALAGTIANWSMIGAAYLALAGGLVTMRITDAHPHGIDQSVYLGEQR